jgi:hypothetical protein
LYFSYSIGIVTREVGLLKVSQPVVLSSSLADDIGYYGHESLCEDAMFAVFAWVRLIPGVTFRLKDWGRR